jgi:hypothetical protein
MRALVIALVFVGGCTALPEDGALQCNPDPKRACPSGFACAYDNRCYRNGHGPNDMGISDGDMAGTDMAPVGDLATVACAPPTGTQSTQCPAAQPVCATNGACRPCAVHSECTLGICKTDGTCAVAAEIAFVDSGSAACSDNPHVSSLAAPYCQVQPAIEAFGGYPYIHVAGSATAYTPLKLYTPEPQAIDVTIVGPGRDLMGTAAAQFYDPSSSGISIATTGGATKSISLTVDNMFIAGGNINGYGLDCTQGSSPVTISIRNAYVKGASNFGIANSGCTLLVDRSIITDNRGGGIKSNSGPFAITNSIIQLNGMSGASSSGVEIDSYVPPVLFAFNTVRNNLAAAGGEAGIVCPGQVSMTLNIQDSIVIGNQADGSGSQMVGRCMLQNVVTGTDTFAGAIQLTPTFAAMRDSHLVVDDAANSACCVDKVATAATPNADHDFDGSHRPKGAARDIGAHEVQ